MKTIATLVIVFTLSIVSTFSQDISGDWSGKAKRGEKEITFIFNIKRENGKYSAIMNVPTFRISGMKPATTTFTNGKLTIDGSNLGMSYIANFNNELQQFEDTYKEGGIEMVLNLKKGAVEVEYQRRPQEPIKPYPYYEEEVNFQNKEANITLDRYFNLT